MFLYCYVNALLIRSFFLKECHYLLVTSEESKQQNLTETEVKGKFKPKDLEKSMIDGQIADRSNTSVEGMTEHSNKTSELFKSS